MLIHLKNLLSTDEVAHARRLLLADDAPWVDGARSAGGQAVQRKSNRQLAQDSPSAATLRELVLAALRRDPVFFSAALPRRMASVTLVPALPRSRCMPSNTVVSRVDWPSIERT